ncbi:xanthine dehydrogenase family protein molybdopterin-binding subunit [Hymenobacter coccineus]|uniref:Aldehyde oxidase/xanthine dehydrogenase second molybdopterin binding domain-containing protein n=1 Tax=Hymenobacter coccineus TaxID=1908235 RepID=A0A1G1TJA7_9BACT|nr:xanthine dehydrogenase family protein molybdopterin-binding subunit [Hymenobacter coccineus]OGX90961.1 hypothetical protein BEN49_05635 [Hymenobacter coccineus]
MNGNLGEYLVPTCADAPDIHLELLTPDPCISELGARGLSEMGDVGTAAITNAVFHATGLRLRSLPITSDKVLAG